MTLPAAWVTVVVLLLLQCNLSSAAFCSDNELAGECFEDKIKPMAIAAAVIAFVLGISTILLATALLCKANRRKRTKVMVCRKPYENPRQNNGFESASQYHVKRSVGMNYVDPAYIAPRNGAKPVQTRMDNFGSFVGEENRRHSPGTSAAMVPGNGNGKKYRAEPVNMNDSF